MFHPRTIESNRVGFLSETLTGLAYPLTPRFGWTFFAACLIDFAMMILGALNHKKPRIKND